MSPKPKVDYEAELNPQQLAVVMHGEGPVLVLAGAGTGKTRTIVYRVCRLLETGVLAPSIMLLTFTNKAARQMLERASRLLGEQARRVTGGTFHSVGARLLRRFAHEIGYKPNFGILDREDSAQLMARSMAETLPEAESKLLPKPELLVEIASFRANTGKPLDAVLETKASNFLDRVELIAKVLKAYHKAKREANLMDFDDLLLNWMLLLAEKPHVLAMLRRRYSHILVDEYQDTNKLQAEIVDRLAGRDGNLMVVGDDAQSIYAFRGAEYRNILEFQARHPSCTVYKLEINYRSTEQVLNLANAVLDSSSQAFPKTLKPVVPPGPEPLMVVAGYPEEQASFVAEEVLRLVDEGLSLSDVAVLYRSHHHSLEIQVELTRKGIPYIVRSGLRFFEQKHVKDVIAHLRFVANPDDEVAFIRMAKLRRGVGTRTASSLWKQLQGVSPAVRIEHLLDPKPKPPARARKSLEEMAWLLSELSKVMERPAGESVRLVVNRFYREYAKLEFDNYSARLDDLEQMAIFADRYESVEAFLYEFALLSELGGEDLSGIADGDDGVLTLSTVHQAKGLEWRAVFVVWLSEGHFPSARAEDLEEERRLFYVAVTRCKERLYLVRPTFAPDRWRYTVLARPSRFIQELPPELYREISLEGALTYQQDQEERYCFPEEWGEDVPH